MPDNSAHADWLAQVSEPIVDPQQRIIDAHHHLWSGRGGDYLLPHFLADCQRGHRIEQSVFIECSARYDKSAPGWLQPLGETHFACQQAELAQQDAGATQINAIVAYADLRLPPARLRDLLRRHQQASGNRLRGIRQAAAWLADDSALLIKPHHPLPQLYSDRAFRRGVQLLGELGLSFDGWHFQPQNREFLALAEACPDTRLVLDHLGTPLGIGRHDATQLRQWQADMRALAQCPNIYAKLGGLAMPDLGFDWHRQSRPPGSAEIVARQRHLYRYAIDCFGVERCLFESNFPVDRYSLSYPILWNAFKLMVADCSRAERDWLFFRSAATVYQLSAQPDRQKL